MSNEPESPESPDDSQPEVEKKKSGTATLVMRVLLFGVLGGLLIFAYLRNQDITTINNGIETYNAWQAAIEEADRNKEDFYKKDLAQYIKGSPKIEKDEDTDRPAVISIETYTWQARNQQFKVEVLYKLSEDKLKVMRVESVEEEPEE